ncbi:MAG TPA: class I SAM-dependent methyltransferase [Solirubrobacteraceae bacterium]|nr:class I SAM-dependent methyltransferase [Solirubrobacteraceae bacterium]
MTGFRPDYDPMATDPGRWGHSLGNVAEILFQCLDACAPRSVVEVGAYAGDLTRMLVEWSATAGATVHAIDPEPQPALRELADANPQLELVRERSYDALRTMQPADAYVVDGDHNYYTVAGELRLIAERAAGRMPLLLCHDVCWPHARRDSYYAPDTIPADQRQPMTEGACVYPGISDTHDGGLVYRWVASTEGGPRNGVLTAIEDFVAATEGLRLAIVPAFFGLGVVWSAEAPYAAALQEILAPYDRHPVLERLEANRVLKLAAHEREKTRAAWTADRARRTDEFLRKLLQSRTFSLAVALSRLRQRGEPAFSKDEIRALLPEYERRDS